MVKVRSLIALSVLLLAAGVPAQAQVATATFDGTYDVGPAGMGTVSIVFNVNGTARSFNATFTGPLLGATNPTLNLMTTLDPSGDATFSTSGDPVFGDTTIVVKADGSVQWTTNNPPAPFSPFTGSGMFASNNLNAQSNSLSLMFTSPTAVPPATGNLNAVQLPPVPALPLLAAFLLLGLLALFGFRALKRQGPTLLPSS